MIEVEAALVEGDIGSGELAGELAACADAESEAAIGEPLEGGGLFGERGRFAKGGEEDAAAEGDVVGDGGGCAEHGERLWPEDVPEDVVADPDGVVAEGFGGLCAGEEFLGSAATGEDAEGDGAGGWISHLATSVDAPEEDGGDEGGAGE